MGGYKIVDLKHKSFTLGQAQTIPGIYAELEGNYHKPCLVSNIVIGGVERTSVFTSCVVSGSNFVLTTPTGLTITVTDEDSVTLANS